MALAIGGGDRDSAQSPGAGRIDAALETAGLDVGRHADDGRSHLKDAAASRLQSIRLMYHHDQHCEPISPGASPMPHRCIVFTALVAILCALGPISSSKVQNYPDRAVKIIVPIGPAGSYDIVGRLVADQLSKRLGQSVVVENRPGAGTIVGTQAAINAPADGYTLLVGGLSNIVFNSGLYQKLPYDPLNDLVPVALVFNISYTLVGFKDLPYSTPKELVAAAKRDPDSLKLANAGTGTGQHIMGAAFMKFTGARFLEVPYRGSAAAFPDLLAGRVDLFVDSTPAALPYVKSGQVKGIAILSAKRSPQMPDVPTMTESGISNLEIDSWIGLFAPAKTPAPIIARLRQEIATALPDLKPRFEQNGGEAIDLPPEKLRPFIASEHENWIKIIHEAGIRLD
jgi:tripartite-type tricarboxylate transporter receptor subunit TctC